MKQRRIIAVLVLMAMCFCLCSCGSSKTYLVTFDGNGGKLVSGQKVQTVNAGESAVPPEFTKDGMVFTGWSGPYTNINSDTTLTASWGIACTVEFDPMGGELVSGSLSQSLMDGDMPEVPELSREGFNFIGWDSEIVPATGNTVYRAIWEGKVLSARDVYKRISPSMVEILVYDAGGNPISIGSGFFIDSEGTVLTNHHVIEGGSSATATTYSGDEGHVLEVIGYSEAIDLAILKTDFEVSVPVVFASIKPESGDTIYALGSALGETDTFTTGIISNPGRVKDGVEYIQIDAALSPGNSGGPLINDRGEVLGVNSWQYVDGQNMNFAIAMSELENIDRSHPVTMTQFGSSSAPASTVYSGGQIENNGNQTIVRNNDEGEYVYEFADYIEFECNDAANLANELHNGMLTAGYVDINDIDFFSFTVGRGQSVDLAAMAYWGDDDDYIIVALVDKDANVVTDLNGNSCFFEYDEETTGWLLSPKLNPGTYYAVVLVTDDYPYRVGCYYVIGAEIY